MSTQPDYRTKGWLFIIACAALAFILYKILNASPAGAPLKVNNAAQAAIVNQKGAINDPLPGSNVEQTKTELRVPNNTGEPGSCHMDECSWGRTLTQEVVGSNAEGELIRVSLIGGTSANEEGSPITWDTKPHDVYVFCSVILPAVMLEDGGTLQTDTLDFVNGVPRIQETSAAIYQRTCHPGDQSFSGHASKLGYRTLPEKLQEVEINQPADILNLAVGTKATIEGQ